MEKEKWKDDVLNSLAGVQRAEPGPFLFTRIEASLQAKTGLSKMQVRLAGVAMVLLIVLNVWVVTSRGSANAPSNSITTVYHY